MTRARRRRPKPPIDVEIRLLDWAARGATEGEVNGRLVPIDRGLPHEKVQARIDRVRATRGVVEEVIESSPLRVLPPCPYYRHDCGGCQWQHVSYDGQLAAKRMMVDKEMQGQGLDCRVERVHGMDEPWRYRRTAAIAIGWEAGFRPRGRRGIVEIHDCLISHPLIGSLADQLNELLRKGALPNYHGKVWLDCTVVGSDDKPALLVLLQGIEGLTLETHPELAEVAHTLRTFENVVSVAYRHRTGEVKALEGEPWSTIEVAGRPMHVAAGSFVQTNLQMLRLVIDRMRHELSDRTVRQAADVYGGIGTFGLALARLAGTMTLIEVDSQAVEAARFTAQQWGLHNIEFITRHAERALPGMTELDLAIVDPPRSGLGTAVIDALISNRVPLIFYVSCAPASLARDLSSLQNNGFFVRALEVFDFYPQTYHVEALAILAK